MDNLICKIIKKPEKIFYGFQKAGLMNWMSDEQYIRFSYRMIFGRRLNLENPQAYTEKLAWCKLYWRSPLASQCADKYMVREYVVSKLGEDAARYLNQIYGLWNRLDEIDLHALPEQFVLKSTNGSGNVVICKNKAAFNWKAAKRRLLMYSRWHFSNLTKEWVYYDLPQRFIVERYISCLDGKAIKDYKFLCFHGEPKVLYVCSQRNHNPRYDFFDMQWNPIPIFVNERQESIEKPALFDEMVWLARKLSADFPHVRVDLYQEEGKIYFGELTFFDSGGFTKFEPDYYDFAFGKYFDLSRIPIDERIGGK